MKSLSHAWILATPRTVAYQSPPPMQFPRQEYWSGLPFPTAGVLPHPGINLTSPALAGRCFTAEPPGKPNEYLHQHKWEETERHTHKRDTGTISTRVIEDIYMQRRHQVCKNQGPRRISQAILFFPTTACFPESTSDRSRSSYSVSSTEL